MITCVIGDHRLVLLIVGGDSYGDSGQKASQFKVFVNFQGFVRKCEVMLQISEVTLASFRTLSAQCFRSVTF